MVKVIGWEIHYCYLNPYKVWSARICVCALCTVCVSMRVRLCVCPSGCDCAGDDDNGCPWDVEAESLQATLPGLTEHHDIFIHLFFCSVSLESVWRASPCQFNLQDDFWLSDCTVSLVLCLRCVCGCDWLQLVFFFLHTNALAWWHHVTWIDVDKMPA